jgi:DNA topoisomerase-1
MRIAQQLYEGLELEKGDATGLITYMRTDSLNISQEASQQAAEYIKSRFGKDYLPKHYVHFKKSGQKTQDAHEAIRPTSIAMSPDLVRKFLNQEQNKVYEMIWKRFLQSQMPSAIFNVRTVDVCAVDSVNGKECIFRSSFSSIVFDGFLKLDEAHKDPSIYNAPLSKGEILELINLIPSQHFTKPPARYSDASLVKELEEKGIGRPSTYAPTIQTIVDRHYVERKAGYFYPTEVGTVVTGLLVKHFPDILNVSFTAYMEEQLDKVEAGLTDWVKIISDFYTPFEKDLSLAQSGMKDMKKEKIVTEYKCRLCGKPMIFRWSRRGAFLGCSGFPRCKYSMPAKKTDDGKIELVTVETVDRVCDKCGKPMMVKHYNKGRFLSCSDYPACRNTKPYPTGVKCPKQGCDGELVERFSRRGPFYGCSKYPDCTYTGRKLPKEE